MPIIDIREVDKTTSGVIATGSDTVLVPGCRFIDMRVYDANGDPTSQLRTDYEPKIEYLLFNTVSEFEEKIGKAPLQAAEDITASFEWEDGDDTIGTFLTVLSENAYDPGYIMAKELLQAGLSVLYVAIPAKGDINGKASIPENIYNTLITEFGTSEDVEGLADKGTYDIKYVTSGGYPSVVWDDQHEIMHTDLAAKMLSFASNVRNDCLALIDYNSEEDVFVTKGTGTEATKVSIVDECGFDNSYGAMFAPWATYDRRTTDLYEAYNNLGAEDDAGELIKSTSIFTAPASYAYLLALAESIKTNPNWLAIAGATRGSVPMIKKPLKPISNTLANKLQPEKSGRSMNAITNINPYGNCIWGNRTLSNMKEGLVATDSLHIRNMVNDIKKVCYTSARACMFEQDTDVLWINFKSRITPLLDRMKSGYGISGYRIVRDMDRVEATQNATICAKVIIFPTFAVENFYITVVLENGEVTVE